MQTLSAKGGSATLEMLLPSCFFPQRSRAFPRAELLAHSCWNAYWVAQPGVGAKVWAQHFRKLDSYCIRAGRKSLSLFKKKKSLLKNNNRIYRISKAGQELCLGTLPWRINDKRRASALFSLATLPGMSKAWTPSHKCGVLLRARKYRGTGHSFVSFSFSDFYPWGS